eukprot:gb/GFBE01056072.1/.p1 GENE.gb/GFBE01056072.1/~~gb/GFBE01056072.1/.p1  ORF type:complete len:218 (+),score=29.57 gb/GFBE01056072.1/:1-654(+)
MPGRRSRSRDRRSRDRSRDRRRSRSRRDRRGRSRDRRSRSRGRREEPAYRPPPRGAPRSTPMSAPPPEKKEEEPDEGVTLEQRQKSIECDGHLYAAIDFTAPQSIPEIGLETTKYYNPNEGSKGLTYCRLPAGWELAEASDNVKEKVIKPYPWGTHLLVAVDKKAYQTAKGERPGSLEMLWDYGKDPAKGYRLETKVGMNARWHGRLLIRSKVRFSS